MTMKIKKPRGTRDFLPEEMWLRDFVEKKIIEVFETFGYRKIMIPTFEHSTLFKIKSGEEILEHMYTFKDKGGRELCLRPEATASVCRMFAEEMRGEKKPLRLYYSCPMFRYEEPQRGRYREFWQIGIELIGPKNEYSDAEVISLASLALKNLGITHKLEINHIGILRNLLRDLGVDQKLQSRIMTLIDKKDPSLEDFLKKNVKKDWEKILELIQLRGEKEILARATELLSDHKSCLLSIEELKRILDILDYIEIEYEVDMSIARGLEYYTGMVFEIKAEELGSQSQICGGGRYDSLIEILCNEKVPAVGFAFGFDRVVEVVKLKGLNFPEKRLDILVVPVSEEERKDAIKLVNSLRNNFIGKLSISLELMNRSLRKALEYANSIKARYVIIVGKRDLENGKVTIKNMDLGKEEKINLEEITNFFKEA